MTSRNFTLPSTPRLVSGVFFLFVYYFYLYSVYERQSKRCRYLYCISRCVILSRRFYCLFSHRIIKTMKQQQQTSDLLLGIFFAATLILIVIYA